MLLQNLNSLQHLKRNSHPLRVFIDLVPSIPFHEIFVIQKTRIRLSSFIGLLSTLGEI